MDASATNVSKPSGRHILAHNYPATAFMKRLEDAKWVYRFDFAVIAGLIGGLALAAGCTTMQLAMMAKVNVVEFKVPDSKTNRECIRKCVDIVTDRVGLKETTNHDSSFPTYGDHDGWITTKIRPAECGFAPSDIVSLELFSKTVLTGNESNSVAQFVREKLSPETVKMISNYRRGESSSLRVAIASNLNSIIYMSGPIHSPRQSSKPLVTANAKRLDVDKIAESQVYVSNRVLLDQAFSGAIRPIRPDMLVLSYRLQASRPTKRYLAIGQELANVLTATFGDVLEIKKFAYWIP